MPEDNLKIIIELGQLLNLKYVFKKLASYCMFLETIVLSLSKFL